MSRTGDSSMNWSGLAMIAPQIDQANLYDALDFSQPPYTITWGTRVVADGSANLPAAVTVVTSFLCPSDSQRIIAPEGYGPTNYLFNVGSGRVGNGSIRRTDDGQVPDGVCYEASHVTFGAIRDGASGTIALGESTLGLGADLRPFDSVYVQHARSSSIFPECLAAADDDVWYGDRGDAWIKGSFPSAAMTFWYGPNSESADCLTGNSVQALMGPRSYHPGGAQLAFCDGHVDFVSDSTDPEVLRDLASRNGGEVVEGF